jgi:hypothetical protein
MLDVHAPYQPVHTCKDFLVIALGLEATAEGVHHRNQAEQALELSQQEVDRNRQALSDDMALGAVGERDHLAARAVLRHLRAGTHDANGRLVVLRRFQPLAANARAVLQGSAAACIPYAAMARYAQIDENQQQINEVARAI